jgi:hypothetical protein
VCFFIPGHIRDERLTLWCFCIFELCCGAYYPVMASLKGKLIDDGLRASVYGMLRVPLNVFVVLALSTTKEGEILRHPLHTECNLLTHIRRNASRHCFHNMQCLASSRCHCCAPIPILIIAIVTEYGSCLRVIRACMVAVVPSAHQMTSGSMPLLAMITACHTHQLPCRSRVGVLLACS